MADALVGITPQPLSLPSHPPPWLCTPLQSLMSMKVVGEQAGSATRVTSDMYDICGCGLQANASDSPAGAVEDEECSYEAWQLALDFGQNQFNVTLKLVRMSVAAAPPPACMLCGGWREGWG